MCNCSAGRFPTTHAEDQAAVAAIADPDTSLAVQLRIRFKQVLASLEDRMAEALGDVHRETCDGEHFRNERNEAPRWQVSLQRRISLVRSTAPHFDIPAALRTIDPRSGVYTRNGCPFELICDAG